MVSESKTSDVDSVDVNGKQAPDRRGQLRKLLALATLGVTGVLLSQEKTGLLPSVHATTDMVIDATNTGAGTTTLNSTGAPAFTVSTSSTGGGSAGIFGNANGGGSNVTAGVFGQSNSTQGQGVSGNASASSGFATGVIGTSASSGGAGVYGAATSVGGISVLCGGGSLANGYATALVVQGASGGQFVNLQEWQNNSGQNLAVVNKAGNFGIGTNAPGALLDAENAATASGTAVLGNGGQGVGVAGTTSPAGSGGVCVIAVAGNGNSIPIVASGAPAGQSANLQEWRSSTAVLSVVDKNGNFGIGTGFNEPKTTLQVNGGVSVAVKIVTSAYTMTTSDFTILANATGGALTVTLPSASNTGMLVFIKKTDPSLNVVTISRAGTDTIEGSATKPLSKKNASFTLVAGGNGVWYIQSNAT